MIKYDTKSRQQRLPHATQSAQKKTHLERKAKTQNNSYVLDLSAKTKDKKIVNKTNDQSEARTKQQSKHLDEVLEDSLQKTPLESILSGRLTIKSINNLDNSNVDDSNSKTLKKEQTKGSEFKAQQQQQITSTLIMQTPFDSTPIKRYDNHDVISNEKLRAPTDLEQDNMATTKLNQTDKPYWSQQKQSYQQRYKDLMAKGQSINKERDSLILRARKEPEEPTSALLRKSHSLDNEELFHKPSDSDTSEGDIDEMPPLSPINRNTFAPNEEHNPRFQVRQIQFNLISSLVGTPNRSSFISRASNKLSSKNQSSQQSSSIYRKQPSQCGQRCSNKGLKGLLYCCGGAYNRSSRGKDSIYFSSASNAVAQQPLNKVVVQCNADSFVIQYQQQNRSSFSLVMKTEDFSDEVDEYSNDQQNHRLSIVKRQHINKNSFSPGSRIAFQSVIIPQPSVLQPSLPPSGKPKAALNSYVTKVPQSTLAQPDIQSIQVNLNSTNTQPNQQNISTGNAQQQQKQDDSMTSSSGQPTPQDIHRLHFLQTIQALHTIKANITMPSEEEIQHLMIQLPPPNHPQSKIYDQLKTVIFDMDETLIHCVDDIETEDPDVVIPIDFPDEDEPVNAGLNIRPYIYECLEEANKYFQVGVFTASHKAYADAILDFLDPENKYFQFRLYRDNCVQTKEGYYVKDLRVFQNRDLKDLVIIDNSVYSFAFQIDNGIPIIPFYSDKEDEEMLHLIYYLNCLQAVDDVREQNKEAFELNKLANQSPVDIISNYYTNNQQQMLLQNDEADIQDDVIVEETQEMQQSDEEEDDIRGNPNSEIEQQKQTTPQKMLLQKA